MSKQQLAKVFENSLHQLKDCPNVVDIRNCGLIGAVQIQARDGDPSIRPFELGMRLKAGFYVRFAVTPYSFRPNVQQQTFRISIVYLQQYTNTYTKLIRAVNIKNTTNSI